MAALVAILNNPYQVASGVNTINALARNKLNNKIPTMSDNILEKKVQFSPHDCEVMNAISSELVHCHAFYLCNDSSILQKPSLF
jgi:hypothetical protein